MILPFEKREVFCDGGAWSDDHLALRVVFTAMCVMVDQSMWGAREGESLHEDGAWLRVFSDSADSADSDDSVDSDDSDKILN